MRITAAERKNLVFRADDDHCKETSCNIFKCIAYVPSCAKYFIDMNLILHLFENKNPTMYIQLILVLQVRKLWLRKFGNLARLT